MSLQSEFDAEGFLCALAIAQTMEETGVARLLNSALAAASKPFLSASTENKVYLLERAVAIATGQRDENKGNTLFSPSVQKFILDNYELACGEAINPSHPDKELAGRLKKLGDTLKRTYNTTLYDIDKAYQFVASHYPLP